MSDHDRRRAEMTRLRQDRSYSNQLEGMAAANGWAREQGFLNIEDYAEKHGMTPESAKVRCAIGFLAAGRNALTAGAR